MAFSAQQPEKTEENVELATGGHEFSGAWEAVLAPRNRSSGGRRRRADANFIVTRLVVVHPSTIWRLLS